VRATGASAQRVIWHDVECGSYAADLALWEALAEGAQGPVLELGSGAGRVAVHLARRGFDLVAVERDPALLAELERRSADAGGSVSPIGADFCELDLGRRFPLAIAPMQVVQELEPARRRAALEALVAHLEPGGLAALAIVEPAALGDADQAPDADPPPDMREVDGYLYSSRPMWVTADDEWITVTRVRERVDPDGAVERAVHTERLRLLDAATLEREAARLGLTPRGRHSVRSGPREADSTVVVVESR
jgi:SAM-dependent methyltransferase